jgi:hypothetical protein
VRQRTTPPSTQYTTTSSCGSGVDDDGQCDDGEFGLGTAAGVAAEAVVRAAEESLMSGCAPGARATCSAVLSGAFEAYPPLGTTPGALGGGAGGGLPHISWRVAVYFVEFRSSFGVGGERAPSESSLICSFC